MKKRLLSILLAALMLVGLLPTVAFAEGVVPPDGNVVYVGTAPQGSTDAEKAMYFKTLQEAVASVTDETPTTIVMKKNITIDLDTATSHVGVTIPMGRDITLDLNGKTIVGTCTQVVGSSLIKNNGTLTIMDSTDYYKNGENCGYIISGASPAWEWDGTNNYAGSYGSYTIETNGTLIINSGWVRNISSGSAVYVIDNYDSGKVYINGGKIYQPACQVIRMRQFTNNANMYLEINGGILCGYGLFNLTNPGNNNGKYTININGGHLIGADYSGKDYFYPYKRATLNITGGQIDCGVYAYLDTSVTGGTFDMTKCAYLTFPSGSLTVPDGSETGATFDFRSPDYDNSSYTAKGFEYNGKLYNVTTEGGRGTMKSGDVNDWDTVEGWRNAGYVVVGPFDSGDDGDYYRFYTPYDEETAASKKENWIGEIESALGQNCMLRDNGDNTYTVVRAYAKVTYDYYADYTCTDGEHEATYYDGSDGWKRDRIMYETVQDALDAEQEIEEEYTEFFDETGYTYNYSTYTLHASNACNFMVRLTRNTNEVITLPVGVTFMVPNELSFSAKNILAPGGMVVAKEVKEDGTYYTVRAEGQKTNIETKTDGEGQPVTVVMEDGQEPVNVPDITISGSKNGEDTNPVALAGDELNKAAVEAAEKIKENEAVTEFKDVGINEALVDSSEAKNKEQKVDVKVDAVIVTKESAIVETLTGAATTATTSYQQSFDVKPMVKAEAPAEDATTEEKALYKKDANNEWWKIIPNEDIEGEITFRLPIESAIAKDTVAVYHKEDDAADEGKGDFIGFFPIESETKGGNIFKFVELKASEFSVYTYEIMTQVSQDSAFAVVNEDGSYTGYKTLGGEGGLNGQLTGGENVILLKDYPLTESDTFHGGVAFTLDLDGHKLSGNAGNTQVTIKNSDTENQRTLEAIGTYANDVSAFAGDEYDAKTPTGGATNSELFMKSSGDYTVVVTASTTNDRDKTNDNTKYDEDKISEDANGNKVAENGYRTTQAKVDVFSGDKVTVSVVVNGANFAAADVTLKWNPENFTLGNGLGDRPATGWTINTTAGTARFYNAFAGNDHYPAGYTLGTFKFTAKDGTDAKLDEIFEIVNTDTTKAYIAASWTSGTVASAAPALTDEQITNDYANIRLKQMTATVTPATNLFYRASGWKLLEDGYTAKSNVDNSAITDATIKYAVLTKAEVEGTPYTGAEGTTESTTVPGYVAGEEPKTPTSYETSQPMPINADDYVIFWQLSKPGYITVEGQESVSIAPLNVDLIWTAPTDKSTGANKETMTAPTPGEKLNDGVTLVPEDVNVWGGYSTAGFNNPTASANALNTSYPATVTMTASPNDVTELKSVGSYTFTADLDPNFNISNPTYTVLIDGNKFEGYALSDDAEVFFDDETHEFIGTGDVVDVEDYSDDEEINATLMVEYSVNDGEWTTEKPNASAVGTYNIKMRVTADGYYTFTDEKTFEIKSVQYYTEKVDYVTGWDLVLVYTDETVPSFTYTYNGVKQVMYDVTDFGYKLGTVWNAKHTEITTDGTQYAHVYGIVVYGNAETTNVLPSNNALADDFKVKLTAKGRLDVNYTTEDDQGHSLNGAGKIDIQDLVATQAVYNVNTEKYMNDALLFLGVDTNGTPVASNIMRIVLRADVSGDKQVDTYDCSQIKAAS